MFDYSYVEYNSDCGLWVFGDNYFRTQVEAYKYLEKLEKKFEKKNISFERKKKIEEIFGKSCE
jgi:hypothetical protein